MQQQIAKSAEVGGSLMAATPAVQKYVFGLSPDEWTVIFGALGALVALAGFAVSWYYNRQRTIAYVSHLNALGDKPSENGGE